MFSRETHNNGCRTFYFMDSVFLIYLQNNFFLSVTHFKCVQQHFLTLNERSQRSWRLNEGRQSTRAELSVLFLIPVFVVNIAAPEWVGRAKSSSADPNPGYKSGPWAQFFCAGTLRYQLFPSNRKCLVPASNTYLKSSFFSLHLPRQEIIAPDPFPRVPNQIVFLSFYHRK